MKQRSFQMLNHDTIRRSNAFNELLNVPGIIETTSERQRTNGTYMVTDLTFDAYEALLNADVSRETARSILPLATSTTMYMKGSVRSWIHYFPVRCDEHTQLEHRQVAYEILSLFKHRFPVVSEAMGYE